MRAFRTLTLLLLCLCASGAALADGLYQVEVIVFRQSADVLSAGQVAPDNWAQLARPVDASNSRPLALNSEASKLSPAKGYQVLLHQAWTQSVGGTPDVVAVSTGNEQFGHFPVEGTLGLKQGKQIELDSDLWINQFDSTGSLSDSERIKQTSRINLGELTFVDNGNTGLLVKVSPQ
jgi:hypothetical protein